MLDARFPSVIHPAVMTHPESGRKCLFLSPTYVDGFLGLKQDESDALLWQLTEHMLQPRFVYRHNWRVFVVDFERPDPSRIVDGSTLEGRHQCPSATIYRCRAGFRATSRAGLSGTISTLEVSHHMVTR
jgi:hypothetical protein